MPAIVLCAVWLSAAPAKPPETVVTLYNQLGSSQVVHEPRGWEVGGRRTSSLVDEQNGFLSWFDFGTGGGFLSSTAALFVARDGRKRLVVVDSHTGISGWEQTVTVYAVEAGKLEKVEQPWFPKPKPAQLRRASCDPKSLKPFAAIVPKLEVLLQLPHKGTTAMATLATQKAIDGSYESAGAGFARAQATAKAATAAISACYAPALEVVFDADTFSFHLGEQTDPLFDPSEGTMDDGVFSPKVRPDQMVHDP